MNKDFFAVAPNGVIYLAHVSTKGPQDGMIYAITRGYTGFMGHEGAFRSQETLDVLRNAFEMNRHRITWMFDGEVAVTVNVL